MSQGVSGVRQCPGRDLILSLHLIYCARHAPHGPTGVRTFCPTSLILGCSTFCTVVDLRSFTNCPKDLLKVNENMFDLQNNKDFFTSNIILQRSKTSRKNNLTNSPENSNNLQKILRKTQTISNHFFSQAAPSWLSSERPQIETD